MNITRWGSSLSFAKKHRACGQAGLGHDNLHTMNNKNVGRKKTKKKKNLHRFLKQSRAVFPLLLSFRGIFSAVSNLAGSNRRHAHTHTHPHTRMHTHTSAIMSSPRMGPLFMGTNTLQMRRQCIGDMLLSWGGVDAASTWIYHQESYTLEAGREEGGTDGGEGRGGAHAQ